MNNYNYIEGKKRVEEILDAQIEVKKSGKIPKDDNFTFSNSYYGWVTGIFVDIRNSTELFSKEDKELVSKVIRSFTSEIIEILRDDDNLREIGIRGDCVYGIFATPDKIDIDNVVNKSFYINTFLVMLNKLLLERGFPVISVGIGISSSQELVVKAGRKGAGINNSVWIGDAVSKASNLSSLGSKDGLETIVLSGDTYANVIDFIIKRNPHQDVGNWFTKYNDKTHGIFYNIGVVKKEFSNWIENSMK